MMRFLDAIQEQTERAVKELKWSDEVVGSLSDQVNRAFLRNMAQQLSENSKGRTVAQADDEPNNSLIVHPARYDGGFTISGGWFDIVDLLIPRDVHGHRLHLSFGGLGSGGWKGDCDIELIAEGSLDLGGTRYSTPKYHAGGNDWNGYNTGFSWFHSHVKSFMFMYLPIFMQPIPVFVYLDKNNTIIGISVPNCSLSVGMCGGSVSVESD